MLATSRKGMKTSGVRICLFGDATNIHFLRWIEALKNEGILLSVISYRNAAVPGVDFHDISCSEWRGSIRYEKYIRLLRGMKMFLRLRKVLRQVRADLIHVHYLVNTPLVLAFRGARRLIVSPWGNDIIYDRGQEPRLIAFYKRRVLRWADAITTTTRFLRDHVRRYIDADVTVVPFGVDTAKFAGGMKGARKRIVISCIKHLEKKYGIQHLIQAAALIRHRYRDIKINIAGSGSEESRLRELTDELGLQDCVEFLGRVGHEQVVEILRETDIFVMPSIYQSEIFGVAAVEASAMTVPVVATDFPGISEAVVHGKTGLLVPPADTEAIAAACLRLIEDPKLRRQMGRSGRAYVREHFEWQDCVRAMLAVYEEVL